MVRAPGPRQHCTNQGPDRQAACLSWQSLMSLAKESSKIESKLKIKTQIVQLKMYKWYEQMQISIWKDMQHHVLSENCKLMEKWDTTVHLLEWPKSGTLTTQNGSEGVKREELSHSLLMGMRKVQPLWETVLWLLRKTKYALTMGSAIMLLNIYTNKLKTYIYTQNYTQMFIAALFIIAQTRKQPRYLSISE